MFLTLDDIAVFANDMSAKFGGNCKKCGEYFPAGTDIKWLKPIGAFHVECYAKYIKLESGLVGVLALLLKSPSRAKEKLIRTLTHADPDQLYRATQKLLAANDYENVIELLNNIPESEIDWYMQIILASSYLFKGEERYAEASIDKSIEILSMHECKFSKKIEWGLERHLRRLQTLDKEKILSLVELILAMEPKSVAMINTKASLSNITEALPMYNELLEDAVTQFKKLLGSGRTKSRMFMACQWKYTRLLRAGNGPAIDEKTTAADREALAQRHRDTLRLAENHASPHDPKLLGPILMFHFTDYSEDKFFEHCDKINKKDPAALFNFYLASMIARSTKKPLRVQEYCLEFLRLVGPTDYDEIFGIEHNDAMILSGETELYHIIAHQMHINALLDGDRKYQAVKIFITRLENSENNVTWKELDYNHQLLHKLLDAWLDLVEKREWKEPMPIWLGSDEMQNTPPMEIFCHFILSKFPNNSFALTKLGMPVPETSTSTKVGIDELADKEWQDVGKYPKVENQKLEFKKSYFLPDEDREKFTGEDAHKAIQGKENTIQEEVSQSVCAFMNSNSKQSEIMLGIDDERNYVGIDDELKKHASGNEDKYQQKIKNNIKSHLGNYPGLFSEYVTFGWKADKTSSKTIFKINVKPIPKDHKTAFCNGTCYVREGDGDQSKKGSDFEDFLNVKRVRKDPT